MAAHDVIGQVYAEHVLATHSSHRGGIITKRAGCTCGTAPLFDWDERESQYRDHLDLSIFEVGRRLGRQARTTPV